jgi:hypothetical protein
MLNALEYDNNNITSLPHYPRLNFIPAVNTDSDHYDDSDHDSFFDNDNSDDDLW